MVRSRPAKQNPFATEYVHGLAYRGAEHFPHLLLERLGWYRGRGVVVGPEGSGKSTLLIALAEVLTCRGWQVLVGRCMRGRPPAHMVRSPLGAHQALLVDSGEQLSDYAWRVFVRRTAPAGLVVVTQHEPGRWPTIYETRTSVALLQALFAELAEPVDDHVRYWNERLWVKYGGNLRLVFREWYELWAEGHPIAQKLQRKTPAACNRQQAFSSWHGSSPTAMPVPASFTCGWLSCGSDTE